jgi:hypothetical protein
MSALDIFNEINLGNVLKEYYNPEKFYYYDVHRDQVYIDGFEPAQLGENEMFCAVTKVLPEGTSNMITFHRQTKNYTNYRITQSEDGITQLNLLHQVLIPDAIYQFHPGNKFIGNLFYFASPKGIGIYNFESNTLKIMPFNFRSNHIQDIMVSNGNIVLKVYSKNFDFRHFEILLKDGTHEIIRNTSSFLISEGYYLFNDIFYMYENKTTSMTYFNIHNPDKKVTVNMKYNDVDDLLISSKCTILICKYSLVIYYKKQVIILDGKDYFRKGDSYERYLKERQGADYDGPAKGYVFTGSVALNKDSNKIIFCVRDREMRTGGPVILFNLDTQLVEKEIEAFTDKEFLRLKVGFLDVVQY